MNENFWIYLPFFVRLAVGNYSFGLGILNENFWIYLPFLVGLAVGNYSFGLGNNKSISKLLYSNVK